MSIKYYQLAKDEELPDEFCAVRDIDGEPSEYTFYASDVENTKLREVASLMAAHYLPNNLRMSPKKWRERDRLIQEMLGDLKIEVKG